LDTQKQKTKSYYNKVNMKWIEVLKKFNEGKGELCVPKKGKREHKEVLSIMQGAHRLDYSLSLFL
jgi:hypothetical protein